MPLNTRILLSSFGFYKYFMDSKICLVLPKTSSWFLTYLTIILLFLSLFYSWIVPAFKTLIWWLLYGWPVIEKELKFHRLVVRFVRSAAAQNIFGQVTLVNRIVILTGIIGFNIGFWFLPQFVHLLLKPGEVMTIVIMRFDKRPFIRNKWAAAACFVHFVSLPWIL
jgi:hypothetical protein